MSVEDSRKYSLSKGLDGVPVLDQLKSWRLVYFVHTKFFVNVWYNINFPHYLFRHGSSKVFASTSVRLEYSIVTSLDRLWVYDEIASISIRGIREAFHAWFWFAVVSELLVAVVGQWSDVGWMISGLYFHTLLWLVMEQEGQVTRCSG